MEVNPDLSAEPELINQEPFFDGWFIKLKISSAGMDDAKKLLDEAAYAQVKESASKQ